MFLKCYCKTHVRSFFCIVSQTEILTYSISEQFSSEKCQEILRFHGIFELKKKKLFSKKTQILTPSPSDQYFCTAMYKMIRLPSGVDRI